MPFHGSSALVQNIHGLRTMILRPSALWKIWVNVIPDSLRTRLSFLQLIVMRNFIRENDYTNSFRFWVLNFRKREKRKHDCHRGSPDNHTITSVDSGSDVGLGRLYRRAWDTLAANGGPPTGSTTITSTAKSIKAKDTLDFRSRLSSIEGMRDDGEIIVHDALPRKHHHHHHHHSHDGPGEWGRSVRSYRSRY